MQLRAALRASCLAALTLACGDDLSTTNAGGKDATLDGPGIDASANCDLAKEPKDSPACVDDTVGVFVSPTGNDSNTGTKASPVRTLATALTKLSNKPRIYMCEGNYPGSVEIKTGVSIYGALKCDWTTGGARPVIQADKPAFGLQLEAANISLIDVEVDGADGVADGESSIAIFANSAPSAVLTRAKVVAGNGKNGKPGTAGSNYTPLLDQSDPSIAGSDVKMGSPTVGGAPHACTLCTDGNNSSGGGGGNSTLAPTDGQDGLPNLNGVNPNDGKGGTKNITNNCGLSTGHNGATGDAGAPATAPTALAMLTTNWAPTSGANGINGSVAQGAGGGGGGISSTKGGAGGGGCGGCGGASGSGGTGGGASIGLLSVSSSVTLTASEITTKQAGNGGTGAPGQTGQLGGFGGVQSAPGCPGGTGGTGGLGGSGSGGAGGVSAPIVFKGTAPTVDTATTAKLTPGAKGTKGPGGGLGNDGPDGLSQATFECKAPLCN